MLRTERYALQVM